MNRTPLLSLCIPTYNRVNLLRETLNSALIQMDADLLEWVEVIVSDNASADDTPVMIAQFQAAHPELLLRFSRHAENIGADANIYSVLRQGQGEFLLALSDDDILLEGALRRLCDAIQEDPLLDVIRLNTGSFLVDSRELRVLSSPVSEDQTLTDPNVCLERVASGITFLSAFAFRQTLVAGRSYSEQVGSNILQTYLFLDALLVARRILVIGRPLIGVRENNSGGYNFFQIFCTNFLAALDHAEQSGYAPASVQKTRTLHLRQMLFPLVRGASLAGPPGNAPGSAVRLDFQDGARRLLKAYGPDLFLLGFVLPLMLLPERLLRSAQSVYKIYKTYLKRHPA